MRYLIARFCPDRYGLSFALWTRQAVRALIVRESGGWLSLSVVGDCLRGWGVTAQRPMRRASEREDEAVQAWRESPYPAIACRARAQGCDLQRADETGLSNQANHRRSFAARGQTPVIRRPARRFWQSMISSLTNRGKRRFMIDEGALKAAIFLDFLRRLIREGGRKLFVISTICRSIGRARSPPGARPCRPQRTRLPAVPGLRRGRPYAPEHNPDEFLDNDLKQAMARRRTPKDKATLKSALTSCMQRLQRCPAKLRAFFQAPTLRDAA